MLYKVIFNMIMAYRICKTNGLILEQLNDSIIDIPTAKESSIMNFSVIDPWVNEQRELASLALLNCTSIPALFGEDNLGNILWGLEIQRHWQVISGRQLTKSSIRIDEYAWFAGINYLLIIVPYIVAMKSNLLPPTQFLPPKSNFPNKFPVTYEAIDSEISQDWTNYFEAVKSLQTDPNYMTLENLERILWVAHNSTVAKALPKFEQEIQLLNLKERKFANGFGHFVEILVIMNRVLKLTDTPPLIFDMTFQQNTLISTFLSIDEMTKVPLLWTNFVETIRNGMTVVNCAIKLQNAFNDFIIRTEDSIINLLLRVVSKC